MEQVDKPKMTFDFNIAGICFTIISAVVAFIFLPKPYSYILTAVSIMLLVIATYNFINGRFGVNNIFQRLKNSKTLGIEKISITGYSSLDFANKFQNAEEIKILAISGHGFIKHYLETIKELLRDCATIKVLISQEGSNVVQQIEDLSSHFQKNRISEEIRQSKNLLYDCYYEIYKEKKGQPMGQILIGAYDTHYKVPIVIIDNNYAIMTLALPPKRAMHSPSFEIKLVGETGLINDAIKHFDTIWSYLEERSKIKTVEFVEKPKVIFISSDIHNCKFCNQEKVRYDILYCFNYTSPSDNRIFGHITKCTNCQNKLVNLSYSQIIYKVEGKYYYTDALDLNNLDRIIFSSQQILKYLDMVDIPEKVKEEVKAIAFGEENRDKK